MKATTRVRILLTATAATAVLAGSGAGFAAALDSDASDPARETPARSGDVTDPGPNVWAANDCAVLLDVFGEGASPYGC